jgi:GT2 family glycosyltransferase
LTIETADALGMLTSLGGWRLPPREPRGLNHGSLIVATYKRPEEIKSLITALSTMRDVPAEVVVVDGSPSDDTARGLLEIAQNLQISFELIYVRSPKGLTRQRNVGVDISSRPILFFLDDDAIPEENYFKVLASVFLDDIAGEIGAAGACIVNEVNKPISRRWRIRRAIGLIPRSEPLVYNHAGTSAPMGLLKPFTGSREVDIFPGGACAIRREVFQSLRFSEFFAGYSWGEDLEMSLRIRRRWRVLCCGDAHVFHRGLESVGGRPAAFTKGQMEIRNRYFIWKRYSSEATFLDRFRFYLDLLFIFAMDIAWFLSRPWQYQHASHALGVVSGACGCILSPPKWEEPAARPRYRLVEARDPQSWPDYVAQAG